MLPSAHGNSPSGGPDDHTRFVARTVTPRSVTAAPVDVLEGRTRPVRVGWPLDDRTQVVHRWAVDDRTTLVPQVRPPSRARAVLPWVGFGLVAVAVVGGTTAWASTLRSGDDTQLLNAKPPAVTVSQMPVAATSVEASPTVGPARPSAVRRTRAPTAAPPLPPASTSAAPRSTTVAPSSAATSKATTTPRATIPLLGDGSTATSTTSPAAGQTPAG